MMRKIRIIAHVSLDGVVQPTGRKEDGENYENGGWMVPFRSPDGRDLVVAAHGTGFDLLLGRRTYDQFSAYWPTADHPMAKPLNAATKYVATHRPEGLGWGPAKGLGSDVLQGVREIRSQEGADLLLIGSTSLATILLEQGLVDELVLIIYPILMGRGKRLFGEGENPRELSLTSTKTSSKGVLVNYYGHVGSLRDRFTAQ